MKFLIRYRTDDYGDVSVDIEAIETLEKLPKYLAQGYEEVTFEVYRAGWRFRDKQSFARMRDLPNPEPPAQEREVNGLDRGFRTYPAHNT